MAYTYSELHAYLNVAKMYRGVLGGFWAIGLWLLTCLSLKNPLLNLSPTNETFPVNV